MKLPIQYLWSLLGALLGFAVGGTYVWATHVPPPDWISSLINHAPEWCVAVFTGLLVYVTWRLVTSTNKLWEAGERQYALEGPFLHPVIISNNIQKAFFGFVFYDHPTSPHEAAEPQVTFSLRNVGRSPALLRSVAAEMAHLSAMAPELRLDFLANYSVEPIIEVNAQSEQTFTHRTVIPITKEGHESIKMSQSHIFLYGEIAFADPTGRSFRQMFCFAYDYPSKAFVRWEDRYNKRIVNNPAVDP